jgi:hypothetical protein
MALAARYDRGPQMFDPTLMEGGGGYTYATGLVARAGGLRPAATPLPACINHITVCATAADSVALPPAVGGQQITVLNKGIAAMQVFAAVGTTDTINGVIAATGVSLASGGGETFVSPGPGLWFGILSA